MLDHDHADRRQLRDLMATKPSARPARTRGELAATTTAGLGIVIDDLIDLILGLELPARTPMPRLTAGLALAAQQLLGLRPRLRPPLLPRLRRIRGRRLRTRPRIPPRLLLQPPDPLLQPRDLPVIPRRQLKQELNTSLPPSVIDPLRLRAIHTPKIRRPPPRTLLWRPTTERLPNRADPGGPWRTTHVGHAQYATVNTGGAQWRVMHDARRVATPPAGDTPHPQVPVVQVLESRRPSATTPATMSARSRTIYAYRGYAYAYAWRFS